MKTQRDLYLASADHLGDLAVTYAESFANENPDLSRRIIDRVGGPAHALGHADAASAPALIAALHALVRAAQQEALVDARPLPPHAVRLGIVDRLAEAYDASADTVPKDTDAWALIQYNGGRAPNEKWLTTFPTLAAACQYAAEDAEWRPELLVDLRTGHGFTATSHVALGMRLGDFSAADADDDANPETSQRQALTSLPPGATYRTEPDGPLLEVVSHGPEKSYVRLFGSLDPIGSSVNTNISPTHHSIYVLPEH
jgi:hypothetical protein